MCNIVEGNERQRIDIVHCNKFPLIGTILITKKMHFYTSFRRWELAFVLSSAAFCTEVNHGTKTQMIS